MLTLAVLALIRRSSPRPAPSGEGSGHEHHHHGKIKHDHNSGVFSIDYYAYISAIRDWNPMFKVFFALTVLVVCIAMDSLYVSLFILVTMGYLTVVRGRIPLHQYISTLTKAMAAVSALFMMTLSTPSGEIISVLRKIHMPKLFVELMNMIYRYIFVIMETNRKMHDSAESRLGYVDYQTSLKSFTGTASNLLVVSLKKANAYYDALVARGYTGELLFLEREKKLDKEQITLGVVYALCLALLFAVQKAQLFG